MWKLKIEEIVHEKEIYGEKINEGAKEWELELLLKEIKSELGIDLPNEYLKVLEVVNGIEFNGFILYGIDQKLLNTIQNQDINGLIDNNKIWYENEWQKRYLFLGESSISWYVYDLMENKYCELDNPSGGEVKVYSDLDSLVEDMLSSALQ